MISMKPNDLTEPLTDDILLPDTDEEQQDEMYEHFSLTVDKGQALLRIDKFLNGRSLTQPDSNGC